MLISEFMAEQFDLPVEYKGKEHYFKAVLNVYGHTYKFHVDVNGQTIIFEQDEEGNYRGVINYEDLNNKSKTDKELIKAIAEIINALIK